MFVEGWRGARMGYAFTDVSAFADAYAVTGVRPVTGERRPATAPHPGRPVRRDP
jgi:hypothetical protein